MFAKVFWLYCQDVIPLHPEVTEKIGVVDNYIIMEINGKPVNSQKDIENLLKNYKGTVSVVYLDEYGRATRRGFTMP